MAFAFTNLFSCDIICSANQMLYLPVAQLDRASDSDSEGRRFKSCRVGQKFDKFRLVEFFIHCESNGISSITASRYCISSTAGCILFRNDDIQRQAVDDIRCSASMIYTPFGVIWFHILRQKSKISFLSPLHNNKPKEEALRLIFLDRI